MNEKVILLILVCVTGLVSSAPVPPSQGAPGTNYDENGSQTPQGVFSQILQANKDSSIQMQEGDIMVKPGRSATKCASCLWPKTDGTALVPYIISSSFSARDISTIQNAMTEFESLTCVRFVPRTTEKDYINILASSGCSSYVGRLGGGQAITLGSGCVYRGTIQHELDHAVGFFHEHTRSDRDSYVEIMFQYISQGLWGNFAKQDTNNMGLEYDYSSVMHYDGYGFSNTSNEPTIVPIPDPTVPIGQRDGLSVLDVSKINRLYKCNVCATLLNNMSGTFTSANYPSPYPPNTDCVWLIRTPYGQASVTFNAFDVQSTPDCSSDYLKIYDGPTKNSPVLLDNKCGSLTIPQVIGSTSQMLIEFVSDGSVAGVGFKATYSKIRCGGTYFNSQGTFTSPGYPNSYGPSMDCNFTITAPVGNKIALTINDFNVEFSNSCMYDYMMVLIDGSVKKGPFCGSINVPKYSSTTNIMVLTFHSDSYNQAKGFQASYTFF